MTGHTADLERLALLVHEVRSPVAALGAIAETLGGGGLVPTERHELVRLSLAACRSIERVVTDVAVASVRAEPVDLVLLVRESVAAATLGGARVRASVREPLPAVAVDPLRLRQVLDNLIRNAAVHGGSGEIVVEAVGVGDALHISVSDDGPGIPIEQQERIFESGARLDQSRAGSGLGLSVARAIANAHGGSLTVDSSAGGATFTLKLPVPSQPATESTSS